MNAQAQISNSNQSVGLLNLEAFELSQRVAKMLSSSTLVPEQYRAVLKVKAGKDQNGQWVYRDEENPNGLSNCVIALNMANRMGADPLMIMQNLYLIEGRPSWSSQFIMASINSCGRFSSLRFDLEDLGEKEVEYQETSWANGRKNNVTKKITIQNFACTAWAIERESGERLASSKITIEMAVKEGWYQKNGSKWQTMPEQMLRYRAASFFGRVYAPELLMGLRSTEEEQDRLIDVTPQQDIKPDYSQLKRAVLSAKSPAELDNLEEQVFDIADEEPRKELLKLIKAQSVKFIPKVEAKEAPPKQETTEKKPTSTEVRKEYLDRIAQIGNAKDLETVIPFINGNEILTDAHKTYLVNAVTNKIEDLNKSKSTNETVDPNRSAQVKGGLAMMINEAKTLPELEAVAPKVTENKAKLTPEDHQELLVKYSERKVIVAQVDIFDSQPEQKPVEKAIARIMKCQTQDEINQVWAEIESDPYLSRSLTEQDKKAIESAADQREAEITG